MQRDGKGVREWVTTSPPPTYPPTRTPGPGAPRRPHGALEAEVLDVLRVARRR